MKSVKLLGVDYEYKSAEDWTLGDYAEIMDATTVIDSTTLELRQLRGTEMLMTLAKGIVKPEMSVEIAAKLHPGVARELFTLIQGELNTPLSEGLSSP